MFINMLIAFIGALGVYIIYLGLTYKKKVSFADQIESIQGKATPEEQEHKRRYGAIESWLSKSQLDVPVSTFLLFSLIWAAAGALILWFATGGYTIVPIVGAVGGVFLYAQWLIARRDDRMVRYEESIADFADRLAIAASVKGSLEPSLQSIVDILPEVLRPDIQDVVNQVANGVPVLEALDKLRLKRRFVMLEILVKSLSLWRAKGSVIPLAQILSPISTSLRRMSFNRQQETEKLGRSRNSLYVAVAGPPVIVFLYRLLNPAISRFFETLEGELLLTVSAVLCMGIYFIGTRWLAQHRETVKFES
jgi:Flp pilus assembly protein TadB